MVKSYFDHDPMADGKMREVLVASTDYSSPHFGFQSDEKLGRNWSGFELVKASAALKFTCKMHEEAFEFVLVPKVSSEMCKTLTCHGNVTRKNHHFMPPNLAFQQQLTTKLFASSPFLNTKIMT